MLINTDLHIHSCFSMATSKDMLINNIAIKSNEKGLDLIGTGDALHLKWLEDIKNNTKENEEGIFTNEYCDFILTTEIEGKNRIHHLIIIPTIEIAEEIANRLPSKNKNIDGRPKTNLNGAEIFDLVKEYDCMIGPAHAFTPWTGMYKSFNSIYDCYDNKPDFVELGLSADTDMADTIKELEDFVFLSNSDAHSPWPHRLGREFNQVELDNISYSSLKNAFKKGKVMKNYGLVPNLGKYHMTACTKCYKLINPDLAIENKMKCECGGKIKKGVDYRISEIKSYDSPKHPSFRPDYIHLMPLAEIISKIYDKGVTTKFVQEKWQKLIDNFGPEITILIDTPLDEISNIDSNVSKALEAFRNQSINVIPGGGGKYGELLFDDNVKKTVNKKFLTLDNF